MGKLNEGVLKFLSKQPYTVVTTIDGNGYPHSSCKGIVFVDDSKCIYLMDLYKENTYENLKLNSNISITSVDEHKFMGYCIKGKAVISDIHSLNEDILRKWEERVKKRISGRLLKNLKGEKGHPMHPEARLPSPKYLIMFKAEEVIDLTPHHIREGRLFCRN